MITDRGIGRYLITIGATIQFTNKLQYVQICKNFKSIGISLETCRND